MSSEFIVEINTAHNEHLKVVSLKGELDEVSIDTLKNQIEPLFADSALHQLIFDLTGLHFINSKGIGYLVSVHAHLSKDSKGMVLCNADQAVMDVITLVGLTSIIPYFPTLEEALNQ